MLALIGKTQKLMKVLAVIFLLAGLSGGIYEFLETSRWLITLVYISSGIVVFLIFFCLVMIMQQLKNVQKAVEKSGETVCDCFAADNPQMVAKTDRL
ncbi:hypothetical protein HM1_0784 [Heliomicrobium modesticaldum Ice1]|uniref:Uncharacterized protein n=1 Tax=Heliobacterium modesticaldum (strain ATCC 51547 / Ice1) TaxID=498761 RepID=B0TB44_HELMI|nr:hypothetical protein [Heliomicrobium modesticaldum]ABZ83771.1 hypothetical protein HM1_0784 [Heliomicrobium modesticaldum Ice1]